MTAATTQMALEALSGLGLAVRQGVLSPQGFDRWVAATEAVTGWFDPGLGGREIVGAIERRCADEPGPTTLAVRGYLGLLFQRHEGGRIARLDLYMPTTFTEAEATRVAGVLDSGILDAYRHALEAPEWFGGVACRELRYLTVQCNAWSYKRDPELVDGPRMCDVLGLFSWFLSMYRELDPFELERWPAANRVCEKRNAFLAELDNDRGMAAAAMALRNERES